MTAAVGVVIVIVVLCRFTLKGKGAPAAKLASALAAIAVVWIMVSLTNPVAGAEVARWGAGGSSTDISGLGTFLTDLFH